MKQVWYSEVTKTHYDTEEECRAAEERAKAAHLYNALKEAEYERDCYVRECNRMKSKSGRLNIVETNLKERKKKLEEAKKLEAGGPGNISHGYKRQKIMEAGSLYMEAWRMRLQIMGDYLHNRGLVRHYQAEVKKCKAAIAGFEGALKKGEHNG